MRSISSSVKWLLLSLFSVSLCACSTVSSNKGSPASTGSSDYAARLPQQIHPMGENVVVVDPREHAWGAYGPDGTLIRGGIATAGADWCRDIGRPCRTKTGYFRVQSLGGPECESSIYPLPTGGAPMPYCMFFNGNQGLHGSPPVAVVPGNVSHGCVRMQVPDAEWLRYNFVKKGTRVIVRPY